MGLKKKREADKLGELIALRRKKEKALLAVEGWVDRAATDPAALLTQDAEDDRAALLAISVPENEIATAYWLAMFYWLRGNARAPGSGRQDLDAAIKLFAWVYRNNPANVPAVLHHWYAPDNPDAEPARVPHKPDGDPALILEEIHIHRAILAAADEDHPRYTEFMTNLGNALASVFEDDIPRADAASQATSPPAPDV